MNFFEKLTGKNPQQLLIDATTAAKNRIVSDVASTAARNPEIQQQVKESAGQKIGVWILDNWRYLAAAGVAGVLLLVVLRKR